MRKTANFMATAASLAVLVSGISLIPQTAVADSHGDLVKKGKEVAFDRKKGNCLACHQVAGGDLPGNIAPPLVAMKARYPDKSRLRAQIWDATKMNSNSIMPPFGRQQILSESEIDKIVEFIYTL